MSWVVVVVVFYVYESDGGGGSAISCLSKLQVVSSKNGDKEGHLVYNEGQWTGS
jgi:hypothetical protein